MPPMMGGLTGMIDDEPSPDNPRIVPIEFPGLDQLALPPADPVARLKADLGEQAVEEKIGHRVSAGQRLARDARLTVDADAGRLVAVGAEDNLTKGASGQAVQCMNLMFGLPESMGLKQIALLP